jgi:hypothetical protein
MFASVLRAIDFGVNRTSSWKYTQYCKYRFKCFFMENMYLS